MKYQAVIYNKTITADTFTQIKRLASIEANKRYNAVDYFYLWSLSGVSPLVFIRQNKKAPNNTIIRGAWK